MTQQPSVSSQYTCYMAHTWYVLVDSIVPHVFPTTPYNEYFLIPLISLLSSTSLVNSLPPSFLTPPPRISHSYLLPLPFNPPRIPLSFSSISLYTH